MEKRNICRHKTVCVIGLTKYDFYTQVKLWLVICLCALTEQPSWWLKWRRANTHKHIEFCYCLHSMQWVETECSKWREWKKERREGRNTTSSDHTHICMRYDHKTVYTQTAVYASWNAEAVFFSRVEPFFFSHVFPFDFASFTLMERERLDESKETTHKMQAYFICRCLLCCSFVVSVLYLVFVAMDSLA